MQISSEPLYIPAIAWDTPASTSPDMVTMSESIASAALSFYLHKFGDIICATNQNSTGFYLQAQTRSG